MKSKIIWFTGLSGSGKTTLSKYIAKKLKLKKFKIKQIDGDIFRQKNKDNKFTEKSIIKNNLSIIRYVSRIKDKYDFIIVSVISPLKKTRKVAFKKFTNDYFEVFTKCSLKVLMKRDTKNLYIKAKKKIIKNLIGYNSKIKYETSDHPKTIVNTSNLSIKECANKVLKKVL